MNKKKIQIGYIDKINLLNKFNKYYYDKSKPLISDSEYDKLKNEILSLERKIYFFRVKKITFNYYWPQTFKKF